MYFKFAQPEGHENGQNITRVPLAALAVARAQSFVQSKKISASRVSAQVNRASFTFYSLAICV